MDYGFGINIGDYFIAVQMDSHSKRNISRMDKKIKIIDNTIVTKLNVKIFNLLFCIK